MIIDYDTDAGKIAMLFTLKRLERREGLSPEERIEMDALQTELKNEWSPVRRYNAIKELEAINKAK